MGIRSRCRHGLLVMRRDEVPILPAQLGTLRRRELPRMTPSARFSHASRDAIVLNTIEGDLLIEPGIATVPCGWLAERHRARPLDSSE